MERQWGVSPQSVWSLVVEHVPQLELPEISQVLGDSLVDMYTEVHAEAEMWREIWRGMHKDGDRGDAPRVRGWKTPLADPPVVRELLKAEICMLLQAVRERAAREGRDDEEVLLQYKADVVNYALSRPTSHSDPYTCRSPTTDPRPSSHCSVASSHDDIEAVRDRLNVTDIDQVVAHLKCVLTEECESLRSEVTYLQMMVEAEHSHGGKDAQTEPTLTELREQRKAIQLDLERSNLPVPHYHPSSSFSSSFSTEEFNHSCRMAAGQRAVGKTLRPLSPSMSPPHPPRPHCEPSPPTGGPPWSEDSEPLRTGRAPPLANTQRQLQSSVLTSSRSRRERHVTEPSEGQETARFSTNYSASSSFSLSVQQCSTPNSNVSARRRDLGPIKDPVLLAQTEKRKGPLLTRTSGHDCGDPSPVPAALSPLTAHHERRSQHPADCPNIRCSTSGVNHYVSLTVTQGPKFRNDRRNSVHENNSISVNMDVMTQNDRHSGNGVIVNLINDPPMLVSDEPHQTQDNSVTKYYSVTTIDPLLTPSGGKLSFSSHAGNYSWIHTGHKPKCSSLVCHNASPQRQTIHPLPASIETDAQSFSFTKQRDGAKTQTMGAKGPQTEQKLAATSFQPVPPSMPKESTRGQPLTRRMCVPRKDSLMGL